MHRTNTLIIGAGHAGLSVSRGLTDRGVEHVVIERGRAGERWRSARWDSFRLLTPNWLARLPGWAYGGSDPDGFMTAAEFAELLRRYARSFAAPVLERTTVHEVRIAPGGGYVVSTDRGRWAAANVVVATGYFASPRVPVFADRLPPDVVQLSPDGYRGPRQVPDGTVLVVGASASGVQIADELRQAGRPVVIAVGAHTRLPRRYRDRDILWWLDRMGSLDRTVDQLPVAERERVLREPSLQLAGTGRRVDLPALRARGVRLTGRLAGVDPDGTLRFADDLAATMAAADARLGRVLADIDEYAGAHGPAPDPVVSTATASRGAPPPLLRPRRDDLSAVVWATGFGPRYPWLKVPVLDASGRLRHHRGVTPATGLYAVGLRFQYRRSSTWIDGARHDAAFIADHIAARQAGRHPDMPRVLTS
ncbi:MAG TPA: FAD-dependent oxidoreductase [Actinoplanes sp.]|nr:FAD-dependent oxidoreductase [Actinoplanes sp.]